MRLTKCHLRDASCKMADFGQSKMMAGSQLTATAGTGIAGTPHWMALEVLRAERNVSEKDDVFSFAVVLWEM